MFATIAAILAPSAFAPTAPEPGNRPSREREKTDRQARDKGRRDPPHVEQPGNTLQPKSRRGEIGLGASMHEGDPQVRRPLVEVLSDAPERLAGAERPDR